MVFNGKMSGRLILIRHGESIWNVNDPIRGLTSRFTGWADIALTEKGIKQANAAGKCLKSFGIQPCAVYTSLLQRSKRTYEEISKVIDNNAKSVPVINSWRLNERHYGNLVGLSKNEAKLKLNAQELHEWRRSWDLAPPKMSPQDFKSWSRADWVKPITVINEPGKHNVIAIEKGISAPETESLRDCANRVSPLWTQGILPRIARGQTVLVVAHANSIRAMVKQIDYATMSDTNVRDVYIPSAIPLVYNFYNDNAGIPRPIGESTSVGMTGRYLATKELMMSQPPFLSTAGHELDDAQGDNPSDLAYHNLIDSTPDDAIWYAEEHSEGKKEAIVITNHKGVIIYANDTWTELCGYTLDEVRGLTSHILQGPLTDRTRIRDINSKIESGLPIKAQIINYRRSGNAFENDLTILPIYGWRSKTYSNGDGITEHPGVSSDHSFSPTHFIAKLGRTPDRMDLPPLTPTELAKRGVLPKSNSLIEVEIGTEELHGLISS